ncbi:hypothetical protein TTHN1_01570 [Thermus thermophilus]|uniref:Uncharacterized protein n=1 Tax=Thermus thermophilus TaxID=274 RepID=A0A3P4ATL9_THETH|nr:hypothetical protein [Thermus thermophilus]VCU53784.1 hypothetical protein TTHN1_01570 [Thermus thermophilus]
MRLLRLKEVSERYGIPIHVLRDATKAVPTDPRHLPHVVLNRRGSVATREEWVEEWLERMRSDAGVRRAQVVEWRDSKDLKRLVKEGPERRAGGAR